MKRNDTPLAAENAKLRRVMVDSERDLAQVEKDWAGGRQSCRSAIRKVLGRLRAALDGVTA